MGLLAGAVDGSVRRDCPFLDEPSLQAEAYTSLHEFQLYFGIALFREHPLKQRGSETLLSGTS
jgi:hypothetical protein